MATIGVKGFYFADYGIDESTSKIKFTNGKKVAKSCEVEVNYQIADAKLYADNGLDDEVRALTGIDLAATPNDINSDFSEILGITETASPFYEASAEDKFYSVGESTEGIYKGFAIIVDKRESGINKWRLQIYSKTKWYPADNESYQTKQESITFNTSAVNGSAFMDNEGKYYYYQDYTSFAAAETAIKTLFSIA